MKAWFKHSFLVPKYTLMEVTVYGLLLLLLFRSGTFTAFIIFFVLDCSYMWVTTQAQRNNSAYVVSQLREWIKDGM